MVRATFSDEPKRVDYELKRTGASTFLIDWRSSVIWNPMTFVAFKANGSSKPVTFRVSAKLDTYFNYAWRQLATTHYSLSAFQPGHDESIHAYVPKFGNEKLFELLKDAEYHAIMLTLSLRPGEPLDMADGVVWRMDWHDDPAE